MIGKRFFQCEVKSEIGRGGMGVVYQVIQPTLQKVYAVKVISQQFKENDVVIKRFEREARSMAMLEHPHIVQVYNYGIENNHHTILMEFVDGQDLDKLLPAEPSRCDVLFAVRIIEQVAEALHFAHTRNPQVIHRDIKPSNILVTTEGQVKVSDFGLAKILGSGNITSSGFLGPAETIGEFQTRNPQLTRSGSSPGTHRYMSPEQARNAADIDARTDIYSMGIVLYELLTSKVPVETRFRGVRQFNDRVPEELENICMKCIEGELGLRYPDLADFLRDLKPVRIRLENQNQRMIALTEVNSMRTDGQHESARTRLEELLREWPDDQELTGLLSTLDREIHDKNHFRQMMEHIERLIGEWNLDAAERELKSLADTCAQDDSITRMAEILNDARRRDTEAKTLFTEGLRLYKDKRFPEAMQRWQQILDRIPGHAEALKCLNDTGALKAKVDQRVNELKLEAEAFSQSGDLDAALKTWRSIQRMAPWTEGIETNIKAIEYGIAERHQMEELMARAESAYAGGKYEDALRIAGTVLEISPQHQPARDMIGKAKSEIRNLEDMARLCVTFENALMEGETDRAEGIIGEIIGIGSGDGTIIRKIGEFQEKLGRRKEADSLVAQIGQHIGRFDLKAAESGLARLEELAIERLEIRTLKTELSMSGEIDKKLASGFERAVRNLEKKEFSKAIDEARTIAESGYQHPLVQSSRDLIGQAQKQQQERIAALRELKNQIGISLKDNRLAEAKKLTQNLQELDPSDSDAAAFLDRIRIAEEKVRVVKQKLSQARDLVNAGKHTEALELAREVKAMSPEAVEAGVIIRESSSALEKIKQGILSINREIEKSLQKEDFRKALELLESLRLKDADPGTIGERIDAVRLQKEKHEKVALWLDSGRKALNAGNYREAIRFAGEILAISSDQPAALELERKARNADELIVKARGAVDQNDYGRARELAGQVILLSPENAEAGTIRDKAEKAIERQRTISNCITEYRRALAASDHAAAIRGVARLKQLCPEGDDAGIHAKIVRDEIVGYVRGLLEKGRCRESLLLLEMLQSIGPGPDLDALLLECRTGVSQKRKRIGLAAGGVVLFIVILVIGIGLFRKPGPAAERRVAAAPPRVFAEPSPTPTVALLQTAPDEPVPTSEETQPAVTPPADTQPPVSSPAALIALETDATPEPRMDPTPGPEIDPEIEARERLVSQVTRDLDRARAMLRDGNVDEAEKLLVKVRRTGLSGNEVRAIQAQVDEERTRMETEAEQIRVLEDRDRQIQLKLDAADRHLAQGEYRRALDSVAEASVLDSGNERWQTLKTRVIDEYRRMILKRSDEKEQSYRYTEAAGILNAYLSDVPEDAAVKARLDDVITRQRTIDAALENIRNALNQAKYEECATRIGEVLRQFPDHPDAVGLAGEIRGSPPEIRHTPPSDVKENSSVAIAGTIRAGRPVRSVSVKIVDAGGGTLLTLNPPVENGAFEAQVDKKYVIAGTLHYTITVNDAVGNETVLKQSFEVRKQRKVGYGAF